MDKNFVQNSQNSRSKFYYNFFYLSSNFFRFIIQAVISVVQWINELNQSKWYTRTIGVISLIGIELEMFVIHNRICPRVKFPTFPTLKTAEASPMDWLGIPRAYLGKKKNID